MVSFDAETLETVYKWYTRREFVHPDPMEFLYDYDDPADREIAGLIASSLAYGRVWTIIKHVGEVLHVMGSPRRFLHNATEGSLRNQFGGFKHRFSTGDELVALLFAVKKTLERWRSLEGLFAQCVQQGDSSSSPALNRFVCAISSEWGASYNSLMPQPSLNSACKRLHLYLRWMVRTDAVDVGEWDCIGPEMLIVPLDTHMYRIGRLFGFTHRHSADIKTAIEVTEGFKRYAPYDPVKYDFALTRFAIRDELDLANAFLHIQNCRAVCMTL